MLKVIDKKVRKVQIINQIIRKLYLIICTFRTFLSITLSIFYCSKRQKGKTQIKQLRNLRPFIYITKYTIEHYNYNIELNKLIVNIPNLLKSSYFVFCFCFVVVWRIEVS
jgi:phosphatidylglycerophosphate synthase